LQWKYFAFLIPFSLPLLGELNSPTVAATDLSTQNRGISVMATDVLVSPGTLTMALSKQGRPLTITMMFGMREDTNFAPC
jgi:hypothetical protein